jgi:hypothetical protein
VTNYKPSEDMQQQHEDASDVTQSRKLDALRCLPGCIARMVAKQEQLSGNSSSRTQTSFKIMEVMDGGGFATLLKGKLQFGSPVERQQVKAGCGRAGVCAGQQGPHAAMQPCRTRTPAGGEVLQQQHHMHT